MIHDEQMQQMDGLKLSNPRQMATIEDWPSGMRRVTAIFTTETNGRGQRIKRVTVDGGRTSKPKTTTYATQVIIADGSDGKTWLIVRNYDSITLIPGTMRHTIPLTWYDDCPSFGNSEENARVSNALFRNSADLLEFAHKCNEHHPTPDRWTQTQQA